MSYKTSMWQPGSACGPSALPHKRLEARGGNHQERQGGKGSSEFALVTEPGESSFLPFQDFVKRNPRLPENNEPPQQNQKV